MLGEHDGVDLTHGLFDRVVDDKVIVGVGVLELDLGAHESLTDLLRRVCAAAGQPLFKLAPGRRRNEDADDLGTLARHLNGTLQLDIKDHVLTLVHRRVDKFLGRAVEIADVLGIFQERVLMDQLLKPLHVDKVVVDAVLLPLTRRTRGGGNGEIQIVTTPEQLAQHRALADARRPGDNESLPSCHIL